MQRDRAARCRAIGARSGSDRDRSSACTTTSTTGSPGSLPAVTGPRGALTTDRGSAERKQLGQIVDRPIKLVDETVLGCRAVAASVDSVIISAVARIAPDELRVRQRSRSRVGWPSTRGEARWTKHQVSGQGCVRPTPAAPWDERSLPRPTQPATLIPSATARVTRPGSVRGRPSHGSRLAAGAPPRPPNALDPTFGCERPSSGSVASIRDPHRDRAGQSRAARFRRCRQRQSGSSPTGRRNWKCWSTWLRRPPIPISRWPGSTG